jgi:hypothetical protein
MLLGDGGGFGGDGAEEGGAPEDRPLSVVVFEIGH